MSSKKKKKTDTSAADRSGPVKDAAEEVEATGTAGADEPELTLVEPEPEAPVDEGLQTRLLRLQADFENFRRRTQRERAELYQRANEDLIEELLPVLDHFELGFQNADEHEANPDVVAGFRMVFDQCLSTLGKFGLKAVDAVGETFDPHNHEAITQMPSQEFREGVVVVQTRRGYRLGDKLLRAAQVVVSAGPGPEATAAPNAGEPDPVEVTAEDGEGS